ncbi:hypothetical protein JRO89_XS11G0092900 [Xanthoceras sorbifolium]|uniref:Uncharacterized protein n=1 Tax=Xanthoceras sorbifolium TaxID=99658 RepID=A0ABQ8HF84_9ROSI|nr:hypothetical protein JRO89_XS11G0092900 [Xanthoceras sorbifolium]
MAVSVRALECEGLGLKTMAETEKSNDIQQSLKPFFQRASAAEDRLARLEAALASKKDSGEEQLQKTISELQSKLEDAKAEAEKLAVENERLKYRLKHLIRAVEASDLKLQSM